MSVKKYIWYCILYHLVMFIGFYNVDLLVKKTIDLISLDVDIYIGVNVVFVLISTFIVKRLYSKIFVESYEIIKSKKWIYYFLSLCVADVIVLFVKLGKDFYTIYR